MKNVLFVNSVYNSQIHVCKFTQYHIIHVCIAHIKIYMYTCMCMFIHQSVISTVYILFLNTCKLHVFIYLQNNLTQSQDKALRRISEMKEVTRYFHASHVYIVHTCMLNSAWACYCGCMYFL